MTLQKIIDRLEELKNEIALKKDDDDGNLYNAAFDIENAITCLHDYNN